MSHPEKHKSHRTGWLRASVLGANDGIVSTSSLIIGVAAANSSHSNILLVGLAGLVSGAMSMAAGEYVSVSSQSDTEKADLEIEKRALSKNFESEKHELADIYKTYGLTSDLAAQVADQLMKHDALGAHARDEIGIIATAKARPIQAAFTSAATFIVGGALPILTAILSPIDQLINIVAVFSLVFLALLGGISAKAGGAKVLKASFRVVFWGALAMLLTAGVGRLFDVVL